jgi:hypothetical protein
MYRIKNTEEIGKGQHWDKIVVVWKPGSILSCITFQVEIGIFLQ